MASLSKTPYFQRGQQSMDVWIIWRAFSENFNQIGPNGDPGQSQRPELAPWSLPATPN
jgi:hypothetical protein